MSLNWKEINLVLEELDLAGAQIQKIVQPSYDVLVFSLYKKGRAVELLIAITPGACRLHATTRQVPKPAKPPRFAQFLKSRIKDKRIEELVQLGRDRIVRFTLRHGDRSYRLYLRLWSNAANMIVVDEAGMVLDAMRRLPKRGEITGKLYPLALAEDQGVLKEQSGDSPTPTTFTYSVRDLPGEGSFNERLDAWYAEQSGFLSLEALRERVRKTYDGRVERLRAAAERLDQKQRDYAAADGLKRAGDLILSNIQLAEKGAAWLEVSDWESGELVRIKMDPLIAPQASAEAYYERYHKAKSGLAELEAELAANTEAAAKLIEERDRLLAEENPFRLMARLKSDQKRPKAAGKTRPGLAFRHRGWLFLVGRSAAENDELLRRHVKGSDLWLHARDWPGAYVFVKARSGKSYPLDALLDAGNLALFYSKGRAAGQGDLYYTPVKYLRRAKNGPKGLVLPTQEKNIRVKIEAARLKALEAGREE